jgi:hypothetical protein
MALGSLFKSRASSPGADFTARDPEKEGAVENQYADQVPPSADAIRIDAEIEKRVVRKLDKRLISLVFVLCTHRRPHLLTPDQ